MGIAESIASNAKIKMGASCTTCNAIAALSEKDRADFAPVLLPASGFSNMSLTRILNAEGFSIGVSALSRHRRGECAGARVNQ